MWSPTGFNLKKNTGAFFISDGIREKKSRIYFELVQVIGNTKSPGIEGRTRWWSYLSYFPIFELTSPKLLNRRGDITSGDL